MNEYGSIDERPLRLQTVEGNDKYSAKQSNIRSPSVGCREMHSGVAAVFEAENSRGFQAPVSPLSPG